MILYAPSAGPARICLSLPNKYIMNIPVSIPRDLSRGRFINIGLTRRIERQPYVMLYE